MDVVKLLTDGSARVVPLLGLAGELIEHIQVILLREELRLVEERFCLRRVRKVLDWSWNGRDFVHVLIYMHSPAHERIGSHKHRSGTTELIAFVCNFFFVKMQPCFYKHLFIVVSPVLGRLSKIVPSIIFWPICATMRIS